MPIDLDIVDGVAAGGSVPALKAGSIRFPRSVELVLVLWVDVRQGWWYAIVAGVRTGLAGRRPRRAWLSGAGVVGTGWAPAEGRRLRRWRRRVRGGWRRWWR